MNNKFINQITCLLFALCVLAFVSTFFINELLPKPMEGMGLFSVLFAVVGVLLGLTIIITLPKGE